VAITDPGRHQIAELQLDQGRCERHVFGASLGGIGKGEIHRAHLQRVEHQRQPAELDHLHRHTEPIAQRLAQLHRHAGSLTRLRIDHQRRGTARIHAHAQGAGGRQNPGDRGRRRGATGDQQRYAYGR
jgi:hypothetical protein